MKKLSAALALSVALSGCVHFPKRSGSMLGDLLYLKSHGHSPDEVDLPNRPWLALLLDILPLPGVGHYYIGDISDGLKTSFTFFLVVPWIINPIHAWKQASYDNDVYYIEYAHEHGWFDERDQERAKLAEAKEAPAPAPAPPAPAPPPSRAVEAARPTTCPDCGEKYLPGADSCAVCGHKR